MGYVVAAGPLTVQHESLFGSRMSMLFYKVCESLSTDTRIFYNFIWIYYPKAIFKRLNPVYTVVRVDVLRNGEILVGWFEMKRYGHNI